MLQILPAGVVTVAYIGATILFILALGGLSHPETARRGNLFGIIGRAAGSTDFAYSEVMEEAGEKGLVWTEETLAAYLPDPSKFLEEFSGDASGKSKMTFKLTKGAEDMAAYLASLPQ